MYARDGRRCRWCGRTNAGLHIHHVIYRSAGGGHDPAILICLCPEHHRLVHQNKAKYTPLLQELLRRGVAVTGLQLSRWNRRDHLTARTSDNPNVGPWIRNLEG